MQPNPATSTPTLLHRLSLHHTIFSNCHAQSNGSIAYGGALSLIGVNADLYQIKVSQCSAGVGGAMWSTQARFDLKLCTFESNHAFVTGGALVHEHNTARVSTIAASIFRFNGGPSVVMATSPISWVCQPGQWMAPTGRVEEHNGDFVGCPFQCSPGFYSGDVTSHSSPTCLAPCTLGHFCPLGTVWPVPCPLGTMMNFEGAASQQSCIPC